MVLPGCSAHWRSWAYPFTGDDAVAYRKTQVSETPASSYSRALIYLYHETAKPAPCLDVLLMVAIVFPVCPPAVRCRSMRDLLFFTGLVPA